MIQSRFVTGGKLKVVRQPAKTLLGWDFPAERTTELHAPRLASFNLITNKGNWVSEKVEITLRLPTETIDTLKAISELSGVQIESVFNVILATFIFNNK